MGIFSKTEKVEMLLSIRYISPEEQNMTEEEIENDCCIDFELHGELNGISFYDYSSNCFRDVTIFENGGFELVKENLILCGERTIPAIVKIKKGKVKACIIQINDLVLTFGDDKLKTLEECSGGVFDKSIRERLSSD